MKKLYYLILLVFGIYYSQNVTNEGNRLYDDVNGKIITNPNIIKQIESNKSKERASLKQGTNRISADQKLLKCVLIVGSSNMKH
jgi:hypothetical protein